MRRALDHIESGRLEKVVLARKRELLLPGDFDSVAVVRRLRDERRSCFTFRFAPGTSVFLGSSPELLVRVTGRRVEACALAGTSSRGSTPESDRASADALFASSKDRCEQGVVVSAAIDVLRSLGGRIDVDDAPRILSLPEAHHLISRIRVALREPVGVLRLVDRLHPTPATCGSPPLAAGALIENDEADRGWYTGGIGWISPQGDGTFAVALRSAVVDAGRLVAWAGAGIVKGSQPESEFAETDLKLRAVLGALGL